MKLLRTLSSVALAVGLLAACGGGAADDLVDPVGTWSAEGENPPTVTVNQDGTAEAFDGCNNMAGGWELELPDKIQFSQMVGTMMFCDGVDAWLATIDHATFTQDTLTAFDMGGSKLGTLTR